MANSKPDGERRLERRDLGPEDVLAAFQHAGDRGVDRGFPLEVAGARVGLRDRAEDHRGPK